MPVKRGIPPSIQNPFSAELLPVWLPYACKMLASPSWLLRHPDEFHPQALAAFLPHPGWVDREQQQVIDFQNAQIRVLMDNMGRKESYSMTPSVASWPSKAKLWAENGITPIVLD
jgi:hypothetical protein